MFTWSAHHIHLYKSVVHANAYAQFRNIYLRLDFYLAAFFSRQCRLFEIYIQLQTAFEFLEKDEELLYCLCDQGEREKGAGDLPLQSS